MFFFYDFLRVCVVLGLLFVVTSLLVILLEGGL